MADLEIFVKNDFKKLQFQPQLKKLWKVNSDAGYSTKTDEKSYAII